MKENNSELTMKRNCHKLNLLIVLIIGLAIGFALSRFLDEPLNYNTGMVLTDNYEYPIITIDSEGNLFHRETQISEVDLVAIVCQEVKKSYSVDSNSVQSDGVVPMYGMIGLDVHDDLPFVKYNYISRLIGKNGGFPATGKFDLDPESANAEPSPRPDFGLVAPLRSATNPKPDRADVLLKR